VVAKLDVGTEGAHMVHVLPVIHSSHPFMCKSTGTLIAHPPHIQGAGRLDDDISQVKILGMMPLLLDSWPEEADIWSTMLCWYLFWCVTADA